MQWNIIQVFRVMKEILQLKTESKANLIQILTGAKQKLTHMVVDGEEVRACVT